MIDFIICNSATGEIEGNCPVCGIISVATQEDYDVYPVPPGHVKHELRGKDRIKVVEIDQAKKRYKHRLNLKTHRLIKR